MALITLPAKFAFSQVNSFRLQRATNILRSKYTGVSQRIIFPYALWMLEATLREYDGVDAGAIRSFLAQLEGQKNTFRLPVPGYTKPSTGYSGNGLCFAVAARAVSVSIYDLAVGGVPLVNEGDFFTLNEELKIVTAAAAVSGIGQATVNFQPPLRTALAQGNAVTFQNPTVLMTAADDDVASWGIGPPVRQTSRFSAIESF